jgi:hypothetical protein
MKPKSKHAEFLELKLAFLKMRESQRFLRQLLACVCLKYGKLTLDTHFYRIPDEPEILTHQDEHGQTIVELRAILPLDPQKHKETKP